MADFSSNLPVGLTGLNTSSVPTTPINSDTNGNMLVKDYADGPVSPGTAALVSTLIGGQYNSTPPTLTTGQQVALQVDSAGRLLVDANITFPYDTNYGTVGATTLRTASEIGNATGGASFNAGATGAQTLRVAANTYDGFGNAITSASNGTAGQQLLNVQVPNTSVTPVALGALNASVSIAMAGLQSVGFQMAAGTFIGTITPQCSVDGGVSWTTCSFLNISSGNVTSSFTFTAANTLTILSIVPSGGSTNVRVIVTAYTSGTANCILSASQALTATSQSSAATGSGTISALNQTVVASTSGYGASYFDITGTWTGTLTFQAQNGDGNWYNIYVYFATTGNYTTSSTTVNTTAQFNCAGYIQSRIIATAWTSGTATISWSATNYPHQIQVYNPNSAANVLVEAYTFDGTGNSIGSTAGALNVSTAALGSATGGTAGTQSALAGGIYNTALPTLTNTQQASLQLDSSGRLIVSPLSSTSTVTAVGSLTNNNAAPAANNIGVLPALAEATLSASRYTTGDQVLLVTDLAGNTNVDLQYYLGAAVSKTNPIMTTISDGTNQITSAISAYGTAPTGTEVMGVNAYITNTPTVNQGTSPWLTKDAADGSVTGGTAGTFSMLAGGQYNSTLPTLTTGQQSAIQLNSSGEVIVEPTPPTDRTVTGTIAALNGTVTISTIGCATVQYATTGTWVATIVTEISYDNGTTWYQQPTLDTATNAELSLVSWGNAYNGDPWIVNTAGTTNFRLRASAYTSGTVTVEMVASAATPVMSIPTVDRNQTGTVAALNATQSITTSGCASCGIAISGTWVGTLTFQGSIDNTNFFTIPAINIATNGITTTTTVNGNFIVSCGGYNTVQVTATAYTSGTATIVFDSAVGKNTTSLQSVAPADGVKATYSTGLQFTAANTATDIVTISGSATKTIRVLRVWLSGIQTTGGIEEVIFYKRSAANTGGTLTGGIVLVPHDSNSAAATATVNAYTANPTTLGATIGPLAIFRTQIPTATTTTTYNPLIVDYGNRPGQGIVLRGAGQLFTINLAGVTWAGNVLDINIEWTEE